MWIHEACPDSWKVQASAEKSSDLYLTEALKTELSRLKQSFYAAYVLLMSFALNFKFLTLSIWV